MICTQKKVISIFLFLCIYETHQNPTKGGVAFSGFSARFPPYLPCCLQNAITFFLCGRQKFSFCLFSKIILKFVCFPPIYAILGKIESYFLGKEGKNGGKQTNFKIILENRQNENFCLPHRKKVMAF